MCNSIPKVSFRDTTGVPSTVPRVRSRTTAPMSRTARDSKDKKPSGLNPLAETEKHGVDLTIPPRIDAFTSGELIGEHYFCLGGEEIGGVDGFVAGQIVGAGRRRC